MTSTKHCIKVFNQEYKSRATIATRWTTLGATLNRLEIVLVLYIYHMTSRVTTRISAPR